MTTQPDLPSLVAAREAAWAVYDAACRMPDCEHFRQRQQDLEQARTAFRAAIRAVDRAKRTDPAPKPAPAAAPAPDGQGALFGIEGEAA